MDVKTTRFGTLSVDAHDILLFEQGLIGLRSCRHWALLADGQQAALGWLQCLDDPDVALGIVSPRHFVPDYQLRVDRRNLASLRLKTLRDAQIVVILSRHEEGLSINLQAPLVINVDARRGRQVIAKDSLPVRMMLPRPIELRRIA